MSPQNMLTLFLTSILGQMFEHLTHTELLWLHNTTEQKN